MASSLTQLRQSGWLHALFIAAIAHPLSNLAARVGMVNLDADPIAYTAITMLATSISLFLVAKPGPLGIETLKRPETWLYGILNTIAYGLAVGVAIYVSATEVSLLTCIATVMVYIMSFTFLGHRVTRNEWLALALVGGAVVYLLTQTDLAPPLLIQLCVVLVFYGLVQAVQKIVVETHKSNRAAQTFHQNMRVTAVVMGVTSGMFISLFLGLAYLKSMSGEDLWPALPSLADFLNWPMYLLAAFIGLLLRAPSKYCEFFATKKISAKYLAAALTMQPVFTYAYESTLDVVGFLGMAPLHGAQFISLLMVIVGSMWLALAGYKSGQKASPVAQSFILDPQANIAVKETISLTLTFAKGSHSQAAKLLGIQVEVLRAIIQDTDNELQFTRELVRTIQNNFAHHVAMADPLTGLANRLQFTTALTQRLKGRGPLHLAIIDLNSFKPVNDTYGHAAGDHLLQLVAKRLQKLAPRGATIARLGGDEFALFTSTAINTKVLQAGLAVPYKTKYGSLTVPGAIGTATAPKDGKTPETLLAVADKRLYTNKHNAKK